jgi:segregation and condensation protein A
MQHQELLTLLLDKDDIGWKQLLYDLVKSEQMDPWNIDLSILTQRYIETIKKIKEMDFRVSGKVLLAAAILLKIKSTHLLKHGVDELDRLIASTEEPDINSEFFSEFSEDLFKVAEKTNNVEPKLIPRTPQPRQRKITIYDLADALQKAMEVKKRSLNRSHPNIIIEIPKKKFDITQIIRQVYGKVKSFFYQNSKQTLTFNKLLPDKHTKEQKIYTFIPLLHLDNQGKINISQQEHFGEISIEMKGKK